MHGSAGSILDITKYRDTCERSIPILHGVTILQYIEYKCGILYLTIYRGGVGLVSYESKISKIKIYVFKGHNARAVYRLYKCTICF